MGMERWGRSYWEGRHYWPSDHFSVPASGLCWKADRSPNADCFCTRAQGHPGRCQYEYSPDHRDYSWKETP